MSIVSQIKKDLKKYSSIKRANANKVFFKTKKGDYAEGDVFIGVSRPDIQKIAKIYKDLLSVDVKKLLRSKIHEERLLALVIWVEQFKKAKDEKTKEKIYKDYTTSFKYINNWDLVDVSCPYIVGEYLLERNRSNLYKWAKSKCLWTKRIAIVSNWMLIRKNDLNDVFKISEILLNEEHDLLHKAVGWMLREAGKKDQKQLEKFLKKHLEVMPRTMLRYAIEKFDTKKRKKYLSGEIIK